MKNWFSALSLYATINIAPTKTIAYEGYDYLLGKSVIGQDECCRPSSASSVKVIL